MAVLPPLNEGTGGLGTDVGIGPLSVWPGVASIVGGAWSTGGQKRQELCVGEGTRTEPNQNDPVVSFPLFIPCRHPSVQGWTLDTGPVLCDASQRSPLSGASGEPGCDTGAWAQQEEHGGRGTVASAPTAMTTAPRCPPL